MFLQYFIVIAGRYAFGCRTTPLTEPEELTQHNSKRPIEGFLSNGLLGPPLQYLTSISVLCSANYTKA
jgi:hypothetical protein